MTAGREEGAAKRVGSAVASIGLSNLSLGVAGQPLAARLASIDIFRGLTMMLMIFVNDLASVKGLPWWTYHMPGRVNGMTYVDMVFPAFLFIVGMSIPLAVKSRLHKNGSEARLWLHVFLRAMSLVVLGLILANAAKGSQARMGIAPKWWAFIAVVGAFLFWNVYSRSPGFKLWARMLKLLGLAVLITMFAIFRRTAADGQAAWIDISYWEILGIIGWAYLSACILYIPTRRWRWAPACWFLSLLALNIFSTAGWLKTLAHLPAYLWPFGSGASCLIVMAGVVTTQIFLYSRATTSIRRLRWALVFASASLLAGWLLTPLGISKIHATPTWCLYCIAANLVIYALLFWICDVKRRTDWASFIRPAGSNALTTYLVPDLYYFAVAGSAVESYFIYGWPGLVRAIVFTAVMLTLAALLTRWKVRMQL